MSMFYNFIYVTFRNLNKNKFFVVANILGLGVALACCIIAYYNYRWNVDFDKQISKKHQIYKVSLFREINGVTSSYGYNPIALKPAIENSLTGVTDLARASRAYLTVRYQEKIFNADIGFADENIFNIFDYPLLQGNVASLKDKQNIIITQEFANNLFGDIDPIGKMVTMYADNGVEKTYQVSAILKNIPENATLQFTTLTHIDNFIEIFEINENSWVPRVGGTFLVIPDKNHVQLVEQHLQKFVDIQNEARKDFQITRYHLEKLKDIPHTAIDTLGYSFQFGLHPAAFITPTIMAILILLLSCLNFINTALATSKSRLKEIGIRKVLGGLRLNTIVQFMAENMVLCFLALMFSLIIGYYFMDEWNKMWDYTLIIDYTDAGGILLFLFSLLIITGVLAGFYPAFYVSKFNPIYILKGNIKLKSGSLFSKILLALQFILAVTGVISTIIFLQNGQYQENLSLGYEDDKIIAVPFNNNSSLELFRNTIIQNPMIQNIGWSEEHMGMSSYSRILKWDANEEHQVIAYDIGKGYFETMGFNLIEGRYFDQDFQESERGKAIIVNEKFIKTYGWDSALGKKLRENDTTILTVIGVVKDFYPQGVWNKIEPTMLKLGVKERMRTLVVKTEVKNIEQLNNFMRSKWEELIPNAVYPGFLQKESLSGAKTINKNIKNVYLMLAVISIVLSLVGLYTLVSLKVIKKTKEIGIRKVLGAPIFSILKLINREFIIIIIISSVLGSILGYYLSEMLLASIYEIYKKATFSTFILPIIITLFVSISTIMWKVYNAANLNPIEAIKHE